MRQFVFPRLVATALFALLALPVGCVSSGKYEALEKDMAGTQAELRSSQLAVQDADDKIKELKHNVQSQEQAIADLQKLSDSLRVEKSHMETKLQGQLLKQKELEAKLAAVVKDKSRLKGSVAEMKQALSELSQRKAEAEQRIAEYKQLLTRFQSLIDAGKLRVKIVDGRMVVTLATDILFASGSARLSKEGKDAIAEVSQVLAEIPSRAFQVEGHTDNVPIHTAQYSSNWELAAARALTVVKEMVDAGMPPARISAASFGEFKPATDNDSPESRAANRRIEIVVVPDLASLPGFDELKKVSEN